MILGEMMFRTSTQVRNGPSSLFLNSLIIFIVENDFKSIILKHDFFVPKTKYLSLGDKSPHNIFFLTENECNSYS